ncbi:Autophagy protein 22 [Lobosporangium transversale]|uniref:Autophagy-related protein n=1 Tax=Lobosporangium transversale TaxID=64571 RepID=A0A1Y2GFU3_9FUNG|nr:autophagy-related protein 22-like protein [Lobosporangium transversale]KAF9918888.1 Autophagy protein 22 [Lobosporangium transversale]ORZ09677.1 autophagy-related protein 22-like protein [Lobosporangium transversale]|eukprot:XP_021878947.1 autophagy-related protein 22-like protein [Lobosporangium transversale]
MRVSFSPTPVEPATTKKEIWAWYSYAFASEAYVVVALTSFIPITLEALASEEGHLYGTNESCIAHPNMTDTSFLPPFETQVMETPRCMISFGHFEIDTASFVMYLTSLAVFLQALTVVSISSMADYGSYRKKQLVFFSVVGSTVTMLIGSMPYAWMAGTLSVIANVSFGAGIVCFNAYLPLLVRNTEHMRSQRSRLEQLEKEIEIETGDSSEQVAAIERSELRNHMGDSNFQGLDPVQGTDAVNVALHDESLGEDTHIGHTGEQTIGQKKKMLLEMTEGLNKDKGHLLGQISAKGFASGYFGGILLLLVCLYISYVDKSSTRSLKVGIFLSGLWWFVFATLAGIWLKRRPGRELQLDDHGHKHGSFWVASQYVLYSWRRVGATVVQARKLPSTFAFLVAWFFLSDGYTSISNVALLFAKTSLRLPQTLLILLSLEVPICALVGTLAFPKIQHALDFNQKQMVLLLLILLVMVPVYGTLGLILPFWPHLSSAKELFALAAYFGFLIGAVQRIEANTPFSSTSFCRSMFADLVPRGRESEFFGLYAITDKGSSWLGPLAVAAITDATHEIRHAFIFLLILLSLPIPIIYFGVDMDQGRLDAEKASQELQESEIVGGDHGGEESERLLYSISSI